MYGCTGGHKGVIKLLLECDKVDYMHVNAIDGVSPSMKYLCFHYSSLINLI